MEVLINRNISDQDIDNLRKSFEVNNNISKIIFGEEVSLDTIKLVNELLASMKSGKSLTMNPKQELRRTLNEEETKKIKTININTADFSVLGYLTGSMTPLEELMKYEEYEEKILETAKELNMSQVEAVAFVYKDVSENYVIDNDNDKTIYQSVLLGSISNKNVNELLVNLLKKFGIECNLNDNDGNYSITINLNDEKYGINGTYLSDIVADMHIAEALKSLEAGEFHEEFAKGLNKEIRDKVFEVVNKKLKSLEKRIEEEKREVKELKEESDYILPTEETKKEETTSKEKLDGLSEIKYGTYAIPVDLIKEKALELPTTIINGKTFLADNNIVDEKSFGEFLVKNGANQELCDLVINNNVTGYYPILNAKAEEGADFSLKRSNGETTFYVPTTENDNHTLSAIVVKSGNIRMISNEYNEYVENGIRYGSTSIIDFEMTGEGNVKVSESTNKISLVQNAPSEMILPVYDIYARKEVAILNGNQVQPLGDFSEERVLCRFENGEIIAANIEETYKIENLKILGFDKKYYMKAKIAGQNNLDGKIEYLETEPMSLEEDGVQTTNGVTLVKHAGKVNVFLMSSIIGFIFGLGIFIALMILKNS